MKHLIKQIVCSKGFAHFAVMALLIAIIILAALLFLPLPGWNPPFRLP